MAYKCDSCGNTSEKQKDCCGTPMMKEEAQQNESENDESAE